MKKVLALALAAAMALSMVACSSTTTETEPTVTYKTGLGAVVEVEATNEEAETGASAQITSTIVAATFDSNGTIVSIEVDSAQQKASFDVDGQPAGEVDLRTKAEKEFDYNMKAFMPSAVGEWFEQVNAFEAWATGKTVAEVVGMEFAAANAVGYTDTPADEDLKASCTISMTAILNALQKAYDNAIETTGVPAKTGLGVLVGGKVVDATAEAGASVQINTNMMAVAVDAEGNVVAAQLDVAQQKAAFDLEGKLAGAVDLRTKIEKQGDYGMVGASAIGKEYFEQIDALEAWMTGKTLAEVTGMPTYERDASHTACPDVEELKASCTITVGDYLVAFEEAVNTAK